MLNLVANGPSGYNLTNSLRFRSSASAYLSRTFSASGTTDTWSFWVKRGTLSSNQYIFGWTNSSTASLQLNFDAGDTFSFVNVSGGLLTAQLTTTQVFRDPSAWYHIVMVIDTTQATAANRLKLYVNGTQVTSFGTATYPAQNASLAISNSAAWDIGARGATNNIFLDGYLTEFNFIDGQALTPSSFGSTNSITGVWQPAKYTGTYGTNGFYLNFNSIALTSGSNTGLGKDNSGNGNYWNTNNISVTSGTTYDAMTDVPTLTSATVANYAVMNPLTAQGITASDGNLNINGNTGSNQRLISTISTGTSGKFYWEVTATNAFQAVIGVAIQSSNIYMEAVGDGNYYYAGNTKINGSAGPTLSSYTNGDVIGVAFDSTTGKIYFSKNNVWQNSGVPSAGTGYVGILTSGNPWFAGSASQGTSTYNHKYNFGQQGFLYTPPTGFVALNTYNLPDSTIVQGNKYMDATLYTGNGSTQSITNAGGFYPDLVWDKARSNTDTNSNMWVNSVVGRAYSLSSNQTSNEGTSASGYDLVSFNSNGFTVGPASQADMNTSAWTFVAWQWQAGAGSSSSNTNGSTTSTVSVNTTSGFSIMSWVGTGSNATIGHGLGVAPKMVIFRPRSVTGGSDWATYHASCTNANYVVFINNTKAQTSYPTIFGGTAPTSTVFTAGSGYNGSGLNMVGYAWAEIAGYSKFGSYTGNGSATSGTFVYTGFRPKYVMIKRIDTTGEWNILDSARNTYNVMGQLLWSDSSSAESTYNTCDFLSNGFKLYSTASDTNASGGTYIYACFAENPFKNALAR
jgi:hypothetical protein